MPNTFLERYDYRMNNYHNTWDSQIQLHLPIQDATIDENTIVIKAFRVDSINLNKNEKLQWLIDMLSAFSCFIIMMIM